jgi:hypothetical protein
MDRDDVQRCPKCHRLQFRSKAGWLHVQTETDACPEGEVIPLPATAFPPFEPKPRTL